MISTMPHETSIGGQETRFQSTIWSDVLDAKNGRPEALERLMSEYWKPVYFFIRRRGHDVESAKDLTQEFMGALLERDFLAGVSPHLGKFRSFVMASLSHFLSDARDRARAQKRGGDRTFVAAEEDLRGVEDSPADAFFRGWALTLLERALDRLRAEVSEEEISLLSGATIPGMTPEERANRAHRLRSRLRNYLREFIRPRVDREDEVDSEIRHILAALG
jgi:RNA polymerase sigma factor (sigma-70 family)